MESRYKERSVKSALDDDDASDIIESLEGSFYDDMDEIDSMDDMDSIFNDEPAESHKSKKNEPAVQQKKEIEKPSEKEQSSGGSRIQFYRSLQGFLQAMSEAAPIYIGEKKRNPQKSDQEVSQYVGSLCSRHLGLVERCLEINNANTQDIMLRYQRRTLAKNLAEMYEQTPIEKLEPLVEIAKNWSAQSKDFENSGSESATGDGWLSVKLSLFTATLRYYDEIDGLWCAHSKNEVMLELQRIAINLAKEVAFSWSKRSQVSDREGLFSNALPHCLRIAQMSYVDIAIGLLGGEAYNSISPTPDLPLFYEMCDEQDMGYVDESMEDLRNKVSRMAASYISGIKTPKISQGDLLIWKNALLEEVDKAFSHAWDEASSDLIDELEEMEERSKEEYDEYLENNDTMDFSRFEVIALERLTTLDRPGRLVRIDFLDVMTKSKKHLAWMWGVSDSLIAARKENVQGE